MFTNRSSLIQLKQDLSQFYTQTLASQTKEEQEAKSIDR